MSYNQWYLKFNEIPFFGNFTAVGEVLSSLQILHKWLLVNLVPGYMVLNHRRGCNKDNLHIQHVTNFKNESKNGFCFWSGGRKCKKELDKCVTPTF